MSHGGKLQQVNKSYTLGFFISEANAFHLQEPVCHLSEASRASELQGRFESVKGEPDSFCLPSGDSSQAAEDIEMSVSVSFCYITNHPQTQWLKSVQFIISHCSVACLDVSSGLCWLNWGWVTYHSLTHMSGSLLRGPEGWRSKSLAQPPSMADSRQLKAASSFHLPLAWGEGLDPGGGVRRTQGPLGPGPGDSLVDATVSQ